MTDLTRRNFSKKTLLLSCLTTLGLPRIAVAATASDFLDKVKNDPLLQRDDIGDAVKSLYQTYNCTTPYPHKFNEVITKWHLRSLQFCIDYGIEKDHVNHYVASMTPLLLRINRTVKQRGSETALYSMFEGTTCSYQLYEHIYVKPGERSFPCPYKKLLGHCKKYLGTFKIIWEDVCSKWCIPVWKGFADKIGVDITITTGETCCVKLGNSGHSTQRGVNHD